MALRFEDMLERLGDQARKSVISTYSLYQDGLIAEKTFIDVASELVQHTTERGYTYGQLSYDQVSAIIKDMPPEPERLPLVPQPDTSKESISQSIETILAGDPEQINMRLARLGYSVAIEEAQRGYGDALRNDSWGDGWTRGMDDHACQLCEWWSRDGRIWPKAHPLQTHKGCKCQQIPTTGDIVETEYTKKLAEREEALANRDRRSEEVRELMESGEL